MSKTLFGFTWLIIKSLFSHPATLMYPAVKREFFTYTRGSIKIDIDKCIYCGMCQRKCPTRALLVSKPEKYWEIDRLNCIACNFCVEVCPTKCLNMQSKYSPAAVGVEKDRYKGA